MKRTTAIILCAVFALSLALLGCSVTDGTTTKLKITATLFPQYDFCKQIVGDDAEIILLLPAGMESHNYEPSVADALEISSSDIFVYTGADMEPWAQTLIEGLDSAVRVVNASDNIELDEHEHEHEHEHEYEREHEHDPHIWTDPLNAVTMVRNILAALNEKDPVNAQKYNDNAEKYIAELNALDGEFSKISQNAKTHTLCHGGRFSMTYFAKRYGFDFLPAFDSCSSQSEPSAARVNELIKSVKENKLTAVFYEELTEPRISKVICEETGAEMLLLHSCHNVSRAELEGGATYVSLMKQNADHLRKALL